MQSRREDRSEMSRNGHRINLHRKNMYSMVHTQLKPGEREEPSRTSTTWKHLLIYIQLRRNIIICFNHQLE